MKITIARHNKQNKLCLSTKTMERLLERIAKDDAKQSVANLRMSVPLMDGEIKYYNGIHLWQHVYPAAEFAKDSNDNLAFRQMNGLVQLTFINLKSDTMLDEAKKAASLLPMTYAAIVGADGRSLVVLVRICDMQGALPQEEAQAESLYLSAYQQAKLVYLPLLQATLKSEEVSLRSNFLLTLDASPYYNGKAAPMRISRFSAAPSAPQAIDDLKAYEDFEFLYRRAADETSEEMERTKVEWESEDERLYAGISLLATKLCEMGFSEEEAFVHVRRNHWSKIDPEKLRQLVATAFDGTQPNKRRVDMKQDSARGRSSMMKMIHLLKDRYIFRYNEVMKCTEYRPNNSWVGDFRPVDATAQNSLAIEVQMADIRVSIKDVRNFLQSNYIRKYNPVEDFLYHCLGKWDGKDRIRALARTVPTDNPHWEDWFYTWFLGMVQQWKGTYRPQYGNSTVPLLISKQGYNKSTFCRRLVPDTLSWGYNDNLILSEKRQVLQAMSQFLLINLDEFNQISPQVQQGFLKNLLQLPTVKVKPPYGSHVMEFPRLASFIATSNMTDILTDPSGSRRFLGVELTGPIDVSVRLNYEQLYAQAMQALQDGEKSYFDTAENAVIMQSNLQFQVESPFKQCFLALFEPTDDIKEGKFMTAASIFAILRHHFGSSLQVSNIQRFGRELKNIEGLRSRRTHQGTEYLVIEKKENSEDVK